MWGTLDNADNGARLCVLIHVATSMNNGIVLFGA